VKIFCHIEYRIILTVKNPEWRSVARCFTVVVGAGTLTPVIAVRVEDGSPSLSILQTCGVLCELRFLVDDVSYWTSDCVEPLSNELDDLVQWHSCGFYLGKHKTDPMLLESELCTWIML